MKEAKRDGVTSLNEVLDVENEDDFTEPEIKKKPESDNTEAAAEQPKKKNKESVYGNVIRKFHLIVEEFRIVLFAGENSFKRTSVQSRR